MMNADLGVSQRRHAMGRDVLLLVILFTGLLTVATSASLRTSLHLYLLAIPLYIVVATLLALALLRCIAEPSWMLVFYVFLLPWHFLTFRVLEFYVSADLAAIFAAWKELFLLFGIILALRRGKLFRPTLIDAVVGAFFAFQFLYLLQDVDGVTLRGFLNNTRYVFVYFLVRLLRPNLVMQRRVVRLMFAVATVVGISGILLWVAFEPKEILFFLGRQPEQLADAYSGGFPRALSILVSANALGRLMGFALIGLIVFSFGNSPRRVGLVQGLQAVLYGSASLLALSRSSWFGTMLGIAAVFLVSRRIRNGLIVVGFAVIILLAPIATSFVPLIDWHTVPVVARIQAVFDTTDRSTAARVDVFPEQLRFMRANPMGIGLGYASRAGHDLREQGAEIYYTESVYLQIALETGYLGVGLFLLMGGVIVAKLWLKSMRTYGFEGNIVLWALASTVMLFSASLVFPAMSELVTVSYTWILVGFAVSSPPARYARKELV